MIVAMLALFVALGGSAFAVTRPPKPVLPCGNGSVKGFAAIDLDTFAGAFPSQFSTDSRIFTNQYSCTGRAPEVRLAAPGTYEIRFPGIPLRGAQVSILSGSQRGFASWSVSGDALRVYTQRADGSTPTMGFSVVVF
jgi:hypothetical protein